MALCFTSRRTQTWKYGERNVSDIGVNGITNHSLRATGADALIQANVPEKQHKESKGHRSIKVWGLYEHTSTQSGFHLGEGGESPPPPWKLS